MKNIKNDFLIVRYFDDGSREILKEMSNDEQR